MVRRLASPKRTLGTSGFIKTGEFSNAAFEENAPATHTELPAEARAALTSLMTQLILDHAAMTATPPAKGGDHDL